MTVARVVYSDGKTPIITLTGTLAEVAGALKNEVGVRQFSVVFETTNVYTAVCIKR